LNKNTKIWLNYLIGGTISALLLLGIYLQVHKQLLHVDAQAWQQTGPAIFLWLAVLLMPVNIALESKKWQLLASSAQRTSFKQALFSFLAGLAFSIVTPNRLGEYPGRLLYMKRTNTIRLISVSVLGAVAQLVTVFIFGTLGLIYYNIAFPGITSQITLVCSVLVSIFLLLVYFRFETWLPILKKYAWTRRYNIYGQLLQRFSFKEQLTILSISLLRYGVFTAQLLFCLRWMNVHIPLWDGYWMSALFFGVMAVIPSIALTELGERGQVSLFLFHHFSANTIGILAATIGLWALNLIIPSVIGSILLIRMRLLK